MIYAYCDVCKSKKNRFIKNPEEKRLLISLGLKIPLIKIPVVDDILFWSTADLADIQLLTKQDKCTSFLLSVIDVFSNYSLLFSLGF